jgi:hypothetical protein
VTGRLNIRGPATCRHRDIDQNGGNDIGGEGD